MIPSLLFSMLFPRFVLMPTSLDKPSHQQPAIPWVQAQMHVPFIRGYATTSNAVITRSLAQPLIANHCPPSTTIRVVEGTLDPKPKPSLSSVASSATTSIRDSTPTPPSRTFKSLSFRSKDKMSSVLTTPTRLRGKTVPAPHTPERERDRDADSIISFTPSMSSKHLANWFSGLLGGG
jgi:hypothetical protein